MEHTLGVRLLDRSPQGVKPTYRQRLLDHGVIAFDELQQAIRKSAPCRPDGRDSDWVLGGPCQGFVAIINRFSQRYPRVTFTYRLRSA
jgi:DNA-binding transcriptional LysR family regulator